MLLFQLVYGQHSRKKVSTIFHEVALHCPHPGNRVRALTSSFDGGNKDFSMHLLGDKNVRDRMPQELARTKFQSVS